MSSESGNDLTRPKCSLTPLFVLAAIDLVLHLATNARYGYHRDELYFLACADHLSVGYVDHSPLVPWIAFVSRALLGGSLPALRFIPALAGAGTVLITGLIARELGAGRFGQALAASSVIIAPVYLRAQNMLHIPTFEPLFWGGCALLIIRIIKYDRPKLWLWVGALAGAGLMNKPTMLFFGAGLTVGLVLTPARKYLWNNWLWAGGAIAVLIYLPNLIWQATHGWATFAFAANLNKTTMSRISPVEFLLGQVLYLHPINAPMWIGGLCFFLGAKDGKPYRVIGWIFVTVISLLLIAKSKVYYLAPAYPMLLAAGAVWIERRLAERGAWGRAAVVVALIAGGLILAPVGLPILPIEKTSAYINICTFGALKDAREVTQDYHDEFGWENQVATISKVYQSLPEADRADCTILAGNYGEAGAIDFWGPRYGLPRAVSDHMTYYLWGPGNASGRIVLTVGISRDKLDSLFRSIEYAATIQSKHAVEFQVPVFVCREPRVNLRDAWEKHGVRL